MNIPVQPALTSRNKSLPAYQKLSLCPFPDTNNTRVTIILTTKYNSFPVFKHFKIRDRSFDFFHSTLCMWDPPTLFCAVVVHYYCYIHYITQQSKIWFSFLFFFGIWTVTQRIFIVILNSAVMSFLECLLVTIGMNFLGHILSSEIAGPQGMQIHIWGI